MKIIRELRINVFRSFLAIIVFLDPSLLLGAVQSDYITIKKTNERTLFYSKKYGSFFSVGSNSFMEAAENLQIKDLFKKKSIQKIYEEQFKLYQSFGFNSLGGWSNTDYR
jgi:hypothetical protein